MRKKKLLKQIARPEIKYVSFDVFDTLLLRPFWAPTDLFFFLDKRASELLKVPDVVNFSMIRVEAEQRARREALNAGRKDITLDEIYRTIENQTLFSPDICDVLKEEEENLELRFCYARESAAEILNYATEKGKKIVAISDMYLPSSLIKEILEKNGFSMIERVYVSGEIGKTKHSGELYDYVVEDLHISRSEIVHIGDKLIVDVAVPRKCGWKAFPFYRPVKMLSNTLPIPWERYGNALKHSFMDVRTPQSSFEPMKYLGLRCMLAVAANKVFDDPSTPGIKEGDFAENRELFGTLVLGLYCLSHGLWVARIALEEKADTVLFFSRDGYLPFLAYQELGRYISLPPAQYAAISRRATLPLLMSSHELVLTAGNHLKYDAQTPCSLTRLFSSVLREDADLMLRQKYNHVWDQPFSMETEMIAFLDVMRKDYTDQNRVCAAVKGFVNYFSPRIQGKTVTYDVGYNLRNEIMLRHFFPDTEFTACFTHTSNDLPLRRGEQSGVRVRTFYPATPYVSWLIREQFLTESTPSCAGYTADGEAVYMEKSDVNPLVQAVHEHAISYIQDFFSIFREDTLWLPLRYQDACLPMETFLHSPRWVDRDWVGKSVVDDEVGSGKNAFDTEKFWIYLRTNYWCAKHHLGKHETTAAKIIVTALTDQEKLKSKISRYFQKRVNR